MFRRYALTTALVMLVAGAPAPTPALAAPVVDQVSPLVSTNGSAWVASFRPVAQPFVAQSTGDLTSVTLRLARNPQGSSWTNFTVAILATENGVPTGSPLATKAFGQSDVDALTQDRSSPPSTVSATFSSPPPVIAGTVYAIRVTTTDTGDPYHWFSGNYCLGHVSQRNGVWENGDGSLAFATYVDGTPSVSSGLPKPVGVRATTKGLSATVSFGACSGNGTPSDLGITNYEYNLNGTETWQPLDPTDASSPVTVRGLPSNVATSIRLRAVSSSTTGPASDPVTVTAVPQAPDQPGGLDAAQSIPGGVRLWFSPPDDNGSPITHYEYLLNDGTPWTRADAGITSPVTISGLTNGGDVRYVWLRAVNAVGASPQTYQEAGFIAGAPDSPAALVATPIAGGVSIAFTTCFTGAGPLTAMEYTSGGNWTEGSATSPLVITGLTDGTPVDIRLRAKNTFAVSSDSDTLSVTPGVGNSIVMGVTSACTRPGPAPVVPDGGSPAAVTSGAPQSSTQVSAQPVPVPAPVVIAAPTPSVIERPVTPAPIIRAQKPAATTEADAPVVRAVVGTPVRAVVTGLPANARLTVQVRVGGKWKSIGVAATGRGGGGTTPAITADRPGTLLVRIGGPKRGWQFIRVQAA